MVEIPVNIYLELLGMAGALGVSVLVLIGLALRLRDPAPSRMHIWAMIVFFGVSVVDALDTLLYTPAYAVPNALYMWYTVVIPLYLIALYFYVRALTSSNPQLGRRDLWHGLPIVLAFACMAPTLLLPGDLRRGLIEGALSPGYEQLMERGETAFWGLWVVLLVIYSALCAVPLMRHKRNIRAVFSNLEGKTLHWLDGLVVLIVGLALFVIVDEIGIMAGRSELRDGVVALLFHLILPVSFGVFALRANPPLPEWTEKVLDLPQVPEAKPEGEAAAARYARSGLQEGDLDRYAARLETRMSEGQLWRDHSLNLRRLASEIKIPSIHLSEVLNTRLGMSFYDYVNQYRIRDACDLLINTDATVLEISETVGFNSKSTFNSSFKKLTQQTPSQWRVAHRP